MVVLQMYENQRKYRFVIFHYVRKTFGLCMKLDVFRKKTQKKNMGHKKLFVFHLQIQYLFRHKMH